MVTCGSMISMARACGSSVQMRECGENTGSERVVVNVIVGVGDVQFVENESYISVFASRNGD